MAGRFLYTNLATTTIAGAIGPTATTVNVAAGTGALYPNPGAGQQFALVLISATDPSTKEITYCTARTADTLTIVRGQEGTTAQSWVAGDIAANLLTAGQAQTFQQVGAAITPPFFLQAHGTYTTTVPAGVTGAEVTVMGAGGGGGSGVGNMASGGGGGSGSLLVLIFSGLTTGDTFSGNVGQGGLGGAPASPAGHDGARGGATTVSLNGTLQASSDGGAGGTGAVGGVSGAGGQGGSPTLEIAFTGIFLSFDGSDGTDGQSGGSFFGGNGAPGYLGMGSGRGSSGAGVNASASGAGGGATYGATPGSAGDGFDGLIIITWIVG